MRKIESSIFQFASEIMKNTNLTVNLSGSPAAIAVGMVCTAVVSIIGIENWEKLEERKIDFEEKKLFANESPSPEKGWDDVQSSAKLISAFSNVA